MLPSLTPGCTDFLHPGVKDGNMGVFTELSACLWQKKRGLLWNEEPYFADLIPVILFLHLFIRLFYMLFPKHMEYSILIINNITKKHVPEVIEE